MLRSGGSERGLLAVEPGRRVWGRAERRVVAGGTQGWIVDPGAQGRSPVGEAVGGRHHPAGVDETPCTEVVPDVDGGQPGMGAGQRGGAANNARPQEGSLLVPLATGLASSWPSSRGPRQGQQGLGGRGLNPGKGFWGHRPLDRAAGPSCVQDSLGPQWFTGLQPSLGSSSERGPQLRPSSALPGGAQDLP